MVSLIVYGDLEKEMINLSINNLKDIKMQIGVKLNKEKYNKEIIYGENRFNINSSLSDAGIDGLRIEDNETKNVYYLFLEENALKYCGRSSLYLNKIYHINSICEDSVLKLLRLYEPCIRNNDLLFDIGLNHWDFCELLPKTW